MAVSADGEGGGWLAPVTSEGVLAGSVRRVDDLAAEVARREAALAPRWLWATTAAVYPPLLRAGVRVARGHDLALTEALLLAQAGQWGAPRSVAAILARSRGAPVPPDPPPAAASPPAAAVQVALFDPAPAVPPVPVADVVRAYRDQRARIAATAAPDRFSLLVAAESAGALAAAEMSHDGLPWRVDLHHAILTELLGPRSPVGGPPRRLAELATAIATALGAPGLHPDSPAELRRAFARAGVELSDTRAWSLRGVDHPAVPLLLEYKELYRIWTAHGWDWCESWVTGGRFRAEWVPGGVVSGRWATRGGGALQIPRVIRGAVVADDGWRFVVADAGQLEPRILAAVSGDTRLAAAAGAGDLYAALAADSFDGDRARAKLAMLGAMYGQTGGGALPAIAVLRQRYPTAWRFVETAARTGEAGGLVSSWLGRTCPPPQAGSAAEDPPEPDARPGAPARSRGRFTRNFVIQATAAEWALALLASLRTALAGLPAQLVFFQHDEVLVHCPFQAADHVGAAVREAGERATALLFGATPVRFPLRLSVVRCYADAA